jgi:hypothetical protein
MESHQLQRPNANSRGMPQSSYMVFYEVGSYSKNDGVRLVKAYIFIVHTVVPSLSFVTELQPEVEQ